jgi:hypothetical protein
MPVPRLALVRSRLLPASAVALGVACSLPAGAQAAATAARCSPPGQQRSAQVARADRADGSSEVTEYLAGGEYRVTRCDRTGRVQISQTVSPVPDPDGGVTYVPTETEAPGVTVAALFGDPSEPTWAATFRKHRVDLRAATIPPTAPVPQTVGAAALGRATPPVAPAAPPAPGTAAPNPAAPPAPNPAAPNPAAPPAPNPAAAPAPVPAAPTPAAPAAPAAPAPAPATSAVAAVSGDACTNAQYTLWIGSWTTRSYSYRVNRSRFNYNDTSVASIVDGHTNWDTTYNSCGLNDITNLSSHHLGSTSETIHTNPDGQSITDRGDLSGVGCAGALACTWLFTSGAGVATETDQRFSDDVTFSNVGAAGAYDYESVATHESGHSIGLDHANSSNALTMYWAVSQGSTSSRTLAKGDIMGLRARYP